MLLSATFLQTKALAAEGEFAQVFAEFINNLYVNTQTVTKASTMCIYGDDDVAIRINTIFKNAIVIEDGNKRIYKECRVIYVAKNKERLVKAFIANLNQSSALTVSTFESFVGNGGMMFIDTGRRDFELTINSQTFKASGVKLDSSIMALIINSKTY